MFRTHILLFLGISEGMRSFGPCCWILLTAIDPLDSVDAIGPHLEVRCFPFQVQFLTTR